MVRWLATGVESGTRQAPLKHDTHWTRALAHVDLALEIEHWASGESECLQVGEEGNMFEVVVAVGASEGAYEALVDDATIRVDELHLLLAAVVGDTVLDEDVIAGWFGSI